jgi:hypothetical protein
MVATAEWKVYTGIGAGTESPAGSATNWNMMSTDAYDSTGTSYQTNRVAIPDAGTNYSYERWLRVKFSGTFNLIENCKMWRSAGSLSDANLNLKAGVTDTGVTPVVTVSTIATTAKADWDTEGEALDIQNGTMDTPPEFTKYFIVQLHVPSTVVTPGDIGAQTITVQYDES